MSNLRLLLIRLKQGLRRLAGAAAPVLRGREAAGTASLNYPQWLKQHIAKRGAAYPAPAQAASFSILTTVYERTDADFLRQAAHSLTTQSLPFSEWILLAHGPISPRLSELLDELEHDARIKVHRLPENLGIVGGMRFCLEAAKAEYVMALDADDLLTPDALQIFASVTGGGRDHAFLFSDEDILLDGDPALPYWRPDWDPVLNLESSYIWHLCAFRRDLALQLGVYSDSGCNWCHDWDTITRFAEAGHQPQHVREILYHWRHHSLSSTNRAAPDQGSLQSTRHFLEQRISKTPRADDYHVIQFPVFRGTAEWHIGRRHCNPRALDLILMMRDPDWTLLTLGSIGKHLDYPLQSVTLCAPGPLFNAARAVIEQFAQALCAPQSGKPAVRWVRGNDCAAITEAAQAAAGPLLWLCSDATELIDDQAPWEALRLMELHADVKICCGMLIDRGGLLVDAGAILSRAGSAVHPYRGMPAVESGPYALALKPQTIEVPTPDMLIAERDFLCAALSQIPSWCSAGHFGIWLAGAALASTARIAYSPLIRARARRPLFASEPEPALMERERDLFLDRYGQFLGQRRLSFSRHAEMQRHYRN